MPKAYSRVMQEGSAGYLSDVEVSGSALRSVSKDFHREAAPAAGEYRRDVPAQVPARDEPADVRAFPGKEVLGCEGSSAGATAASPRTAGVASIRSRWCWRSSTTACAATGPSRAPTTRYVSLRQMSALAASPLPELKPESNW